MNHHTVASTILFGSIRRILLAVILLLLVPQHARAQNCGGIDPGFDPRCPAHPPPETGLSTGSQYAIAVASNAAVGGLTAGIGEHWRGGSFWRGFVHGAAGGGLVFAGKQVSAARFSGAGLLGRQITAVGGSVVNNAAAGRAPFARVVLPLGPLRVYAEPGASNPVRVKADAAGLVVMGYAATLPAARLDAAESLSAGAPVFAIDRDWDHRATHAAGVIMVREHSSPRERRFALAHERVHVAQYDYAFLAWSEPAEQWAANHSPAVGWMHRYVDFGANAAFLGGLTYVIPSRYLPLEREADLLTGSR